MEIEHTGEGLMLGRTSGLAFGFVKNNKTLMPISTCKDFLGDFVYAENKNTTIKKYGFSHTGQDLIDDDLEMAFTMHSNNVAHETIFLNEVRKRYKVIENFVNSLGVGKIKIRKRGHYYITNVPSYFLKSTYLISLFSFMIRLGIRVTYKSTVNDFKINNNFEISRLEKIDPMQVRQFKKAKKIMHKYETNKDGLFNTQVHNCGMMKMD